LKQTIDLIPEEFHLRRRLRLRLAAWGVVFALVCPALFGLYLWERGRCLALERRLEQHRAYNERLQQMAGKLEGLRQTRDTLQAKQGAIRLLLGRQANTLLLAELERTLERGVWLTSLEIDRTAIDHSALAAPGERRPGKGQEAPGAASAPAPLRLRGYAPTHAALARLLPRLAESAFIRQPRLIYSKALSVGSRPAVEFEIEAELRCS
jgi:Tfp pilus assembly protein PilN